MSALVATPVIAATIFTRGIAAFSIDLIAIFDILFRPFPNLVGGMDWLNVE